MGSAPVRVGVVHGSRLISEGLRDLLAREPSVSVVGLFSELGAAARDPLAGSHVLLADLASVRAAGMAGLQAVLVAAPEGRILVFDVEDDDAAIVECVRAGAAGCVLRDASLVELVAAIASVVDGTVPASPRIITSLFRFVAEQAEGREASISDLTPREEEILQLLAEGLSNKEIAGRLFLQPQTVKNYVHLVFQKLDVHSRLDVIRLLRSRRR
ncbi:MAG: response regulator transcription factor [Chloroflexota bacterium]